MTIQRQRVLPRPAGWGFALLALLLTPPPTGLSCLAAPQEPPEPQPAEVEPPAQEAEPDEAEAEPAQPGSGGLDEGSDRSPAPASHALAKAPKNGRLPGRGLPLAPTDSVAAPVHQRSGGTPDAVPTPDGPPIFIDGAASHGLDFVHHNGSAGRYLFAEVVGSGAAFLDYDGDGDLDAFLVQSGPFPASLTGSSVGSSASDGASEGKKSVPLDPGHTEDSDAPAAPSAPAPPAAPSDTNGEAPGEEPGSGVPAGHRLYRNLLAERGELAFTDVTEEAGLTGGGHGMGVAVGDVDGDGDPDLYVTTLASNQLWINQGDGTFRDATMEARADDPRWSTAASFFDADLDGDLDLWVANYVEWSVAGDQVCHAVEGHRDYCGPLNYRPVADRLLENLGDGRFADASSRTRVRLSSGAALGSLALDLTGDPRPEVYVANDASANQLWGAGPPAPGSQGFEATLLGRWRDEGLESGASLNGQGRPEGSMGIDAGDYDEDGDFDLFLTHVHRETNTLYSNGGDGSFQDATATAGLAAPSLGLTGFGTAFLDYDNDGWLDLLVVNGTVTVIPERAAAGDPLALAQPDLLLRNLGRAAEAPSAPVRFADVTSVAGEALTRPTVSRGAAFGDVDNDGDTDVLINDSGGPARLLLNQLGQDAHWLGLHLLQPKGDVLLEAPGTHVLLTLSSGRRLLRRVRIDGSYLAAHDPRLLFGLGDEDKVLSAQVRWPDGTEETFDLQHQEPNRYLQLVRGQSSLD